MRLVFALAAICVWLGTLATAMAGAAEEKNWIKVCDIQDHHDCMMRQVRHTTTAFDAAMMVRMKPGGQLLVSVNFPTGVDLLKPQKWQIDNGSPGDAPFVYCSKDACSSQAIVDTNFIARLKKGKSMTASAYLRDGAPISISFDLAGFSSTFDSENFMTIDQYKQLNSK
ncbi:MAG TPA: invasion associated locus B family protein [Devosiaceae bacterium]